MAKSLYSGKKKQKTLSFKCTRLDAVCFLIKNKLIRDLFKYENSPVGCDPANKSLIPNLTSWKPAS